MVFDVTGSFVSLFIRFVRRILVCTLRRIPQAAVKIPSDEEIESFNAAISDPHPTLHDVFCVADGLKL